MLPFGPKAEEYAGVRLRMFKLFIIIIPFFCTLSIIFLQIF